MAESIDARPATATYAAKKWIASKNIRANGTATALPRNDTMTTDLRTHYSLTTTSWLSYLFTRFVRNRGA
jgi:hypothetical protein